MAEAEQPTVAVQETTKRERTPAQLEALQRARAKAAEVRAKNTELRRKERELVNAQLEEKRRLREETIQREHAERFHAKEEENTTPAAAVDETEEEEVVYQKKPKRKRRVVVVQDSSSEEEIEVKLPKPKKKTQRRAQRMICTAVPTNACLRCINLAGLFRRRSVSTQWACGHI